MKAKTWYLGPMADLRPLLCPEVDITVNPVSFGGVQQALTGATTVDHTGTKMEYQFSFRFMDEAEFRWLDALNARLVSGPFYLRDPLKKNRLSLEALGMKLGVTDPESVAYWRHSFALTTASVTGYPLRVVTLDGTTAGFPWRVDPDPVPVQPGETITWSVYMRADAAFTTSIGMDLYTGPWTRANPGNNARNVQVTTSWQRYYHTYTIPSGVYGVRPYVNPAGTGRDLSFTAPQLEESASPTPWESGGGAIPVAFTELRATSPRYPYRDVEMTLQEG